MRDLKNMNKDNIIQAFLLREIYVKEIINDYNKSKSKNMVDKFFVKRFEAIINSDDLAFKTNKLIQRNDILLKKIAYIRDCIVSKCKKCNYKYKSRFGR